MKKWILGMTVAGLMFGNAMAASQEEVVAKIRKSFQEPTKEGLVALFNFEGIDPELADAYKKLLAHVAEQKLPVSSCTVHDIETFVPDPPLPGKFRGKELEYLTPVKKWVEVKMEKTEGPSARKLTLVFPLAEEGGNWFIPTFRYKAEK